jgi:serine/threonine protein kinase
VKILRPRLASDPIAVKRFLREAEFGSRVSHPNIVHTYDYGESDGLHYLALEWAKGEPLAEFVNRSGKLAPPLVAAIIEQLGAALTVAHRAGIIHRDLGQDPGFRHRARLRVQPGRAAHPGGILRRNAAVRGPGNSERRTG